MRKKCIPINECKISYRLTVLSSDFSNLLPLIHNIYLHSRTIRKAIKRVKKFFRVYSKWHRLWMYFMAVKASTKMRRILNKYINFLDVLVSKAFDIVILVQLSFFGISLQYARKKKPSTWTNICEIIKKLFMHHSSVCVCVSVLSAHKFRHFHFHKFDLWRTWKFIILSIQTTHVPKSTLMRNVRLFRDNFIASVWWFLCAFPFEWCFYDVLVAITLLFGKQLITRERDKSICSAWPSASCVRPANKMPTKWKWVGV